MKVTLLNTYLKGGAGIACSRLFSALNKSGIDTHLLVQEKITPESNKIHSTSNSFLKKISSKFRLAKELSYFIPNEKTKEARFKFSVAKAGIDVTKCAVVKNADIIHLHWINQGFLSLDSIEKLSKLNKPIVWTLHDMWAFTGGCHYSEGCENFKTECSFCPYLKNPSPHDLSQKTWQRKFELFNNVNITFICCSDWLKDLAKKSKLLNNFRIETIPNPIDTEIFKPINKKEARKKLNLPLNKKLILFGAMNLEDPRKGFQYLSAGLKILAADFPESLTDTELIVFGKSKQDLSLNVPYKINNLGLISTDDDLVTAYSSADVFVLPSIEDNLPNTVMESMACGTPVTAFRTGGIPEMISHQRNGFLADYKSEKSLAEGINFIINNHNYEELRTNSIRKVLSSYREEVIAQMHNDLYKTLKTNY